MKKQSKGEDAVAEAITTTTADGVQAPKRHAWRDEVNEYFSLPNERGTCALRHAARPRFPLGAATASPVTKHSHHTSHPTHAPLRTRPPTEDDDFDLRAWWKKMSENDEETLWSLIARVYHGIDATSCQAERNFSLLAPLSAHRLIEDFMFVKTNVEHLPMVRMWRVAVDSRWRRSRTSTTLMTDAKSVATAASTARKVPVVNNPTDNPIMIILNYIEYYMMTNDKLLIESTMS